MRSLPAVFALALWACAGPAKERPHPAEEPLVVSQAATQIRQPTAGGTPSSGSPPATTADSFGKGSPPPSSAPASGMSTGPVPDLSGIVVGARADMSPPLQGVRPGLVNGKLEGYNVPATKPFMGFPLVDNNFVSVDNGKITDVTNGIPVANCPSVIQKLTAKYGAPRTGFMGNVWTVGPAEINVTAAKTFCNVMIRLAH